MDKSKFKEMFSEYCNSEIKKGKCKDGDCSFCVVNKAYETIFRDCTSDVIDAVEDALCEYDAGNIDVVMDEDTNSLSVMYHSRRNSFSVYDSVAHIDDVNIDELEKALDDLDVGHVW